MSDPFQPCEERYHITRGLCDFTKEKGVTVLFSTKTDDLRGCEDHIDPRIHSFQLSVSNVGDRRDIEPNVPSIENRKRLFDRLKSDGFRVGIRIQPFIPGITNPDVVDMFSDADHFTIEGLKLVPQNREHVERVLDATGLSKTMFTQMGLLNLKPCIRLDAYRDVVERIRYYAKPYSIADNDMHHIGCSNCCCGDSLINRASGFDSTAMSMEHGREWTIEDVHEAAGDEVWGAKASQLFTSNRTGGCVTVEDFYNERFDRKNSPFSPKYLVEDEYIGGGRMSYDICLRDPVTRGTIELDEPHQMRGGTYMVGGTTRAWLNVTYNYARHFKRVLGEKGIRSIYGMTGAESIPVLEDAAYRLADDASDDYWDPTEGNAKRALLQLASLARMRPDGIWDGD